MTEQKVIPCRYCKHAVPHAWGCDKAKLKYGTDGYGPWWSSNQCLHDPSNSPRKSLFEPIATEELIPLKQKIIEQRASVNELVKEISTLRGLVK